MKNDERKNTKMMPAICTQCGGQVEVDAQREKAFCQHCCFLTLKTSPPGGKINFESAPT
jgi:DNA-directed RNA polymerase subunit RPC12/RpoP